MVGHPPCWDNDVGFYTHVHVLIALSQLCALAAPKRLRLTFRKLYLHYRIRTQSAEHFPS
jgi:hypothetical protein